MNPKPSSETAVITTHLALPQDANPAGNVHGGVILKHVDTCGGIAAKRLSRCNVVTACIDRMNFNAPAYVGELLTFKACVNHVGTTSMEVGVRVEAENLKTGEIRHTNTAYLTYVALGDDGKPTPVPSLDLDSPEAERRFKEAELRRKFRFEELELTGHRQKRK
ncbi:acyl-CoA thioesterase [Salidesulfovibrio brasiliensis]|uniref:acyl-CoA thioesterase n=1 Tax=Salidesulfovibrio brasiliensis TaxID=221711 RepID=UPI0006D244F1|nr:acyl-CoA thioesterase [Salidesulfovibrio brasiliensis]